MLVSVPAETRPGERRVALTPESAALLVVVDVHRLDAQPAGPGHLRQVHAAANIPVLTSSCAASIDRGVLVEERAGFDEDLLARGRASARTRRRCRAAAATRVALRSTKRSRYIPLPPCSRFARPLIRTKRSRSCATRRGTRARGCRAPSPGASGGRRAHRARPARRRRGPARTPSTARTACRRAQASRRRRSASRPSASARPSTASRGARRRRRRPRRGRSRRPGRARPRPGRGSWRSGTRSCRAAGAPRASPSRSRVADVERRSARDARQRARLVLHLANGWDSRTCSTPSFQPTSRGTGAGADPCCPR